MPKEKAPEVENNQENVELDIEKENTREEPRYFKSIEESLGKNLEEDKMKPEIRKEAAFYITKEKDETALGFMREFVKDNKDELKEKGLWIENGNDKYILNIVKELDWKEALENDNKYEKYREGLEHFDYLGRNFNKDNVPQQAKFLMVNKLNGAIEAREEKLMADGKDINSDVELKKLYSLVEKISSDITGIDARKELERKNSLPDKDTYISQSFDSSKDILKSNFNVGDDVKSMEPMLEHYGYEIKLNKGLFKREFVVYGKDDEGKLKKLKTFAGKGIIFSEKVKDEKSFKKFLESILDGEVKKELEKIYVTKTIGNNKDINEKVKERIKNIASAPEKAEGGIEAFFNEANEKDIKEERERVEKKRAANAKKNAGSKTENKKKESGQKETWNTLTRNAVGFIDSIKDLPEDFDEGYELISNVLNDAGYETVGLDHFEKDEWFQKNVGARYGEALKNRGKNKKEYNGWLIQFLRAIITNFTKK